MTTKDLQDLRIVHYGHPALLPVASGGLKHRGYLFGD